MYYLQCIGQMGFVKRRSSTKAKVSVPDFEERCAEFLFDIQVLNYGSGSKPEADLGRGGAGTRPPPKLHTPNNNNYTTCDG